VRKPRAKKVKPALPKPARIAFDAYLAIKAVNWSLLKEARESAAHFRARELAPLEDTTRLAVGRAAHTAVLEGDDFLRAYSLFTGARRAGQEWEAHKAANVGRTHLKQDEYDQALAIRDAVRGHPAARRLLESGIAEQSLQWTDEETGLACKARLDWLSVAAGALVDLKTTQSVDAFAFGRRAWDMGYHGQLAFYRRGLRAHGLDLAAKIVAVEIEPPHDVAVFAIEDDALAQADAEVGRLLRLVAECRARDEYPGRYAVEQPLRLPGWAVVTVNEDEGDALSVLKIGGAA
jgi:exodeoxyribonuclease VIII